MNVFPALDVRSGFPTQGPRNSEFCRPSHEPSSTRLFASSRNASPPTPAAPLPFSTAMTDYDGRRSQAKCQFISTICNPELGGCWWGGGERGTLSGGLRISKGFTFIEVLVAMMIFVIAVVVAIDLVRGAVRATVDSREYSVAAWLLQKSMVELETRLETQGIDKGCEKKKEGKFDPPYDKFKWVQYCTEIDFQVSETASKLIAAQGDSEKEAEANKENIFLKQIFELASDYLTKSLRELHTEVLWYQGKNLRKATLTTHFARYDLKVSLPSLTGAASSEGN